MWNPLVRLATYFIYNKITIMNAAEIFKRDHKGLTVAKKWQIPAKFSSRLRLKIRTHRLFKTSVFTS